MRFLSEDMEYFPGVVKMKHWDKKEKKPFKSIDKKRKPDYTEQRKHKRGEGWDD